MEGGSGHCDAVSVGARLIMRIVDLHAYPGTDRFVAAQGPFADALAKYWKKPWVGKDESEVVAEFERAGVEVVMVAFDIEAHVGSPPCDNEYVSAFRSRHPERVIGVWGVADPHGGEEAAIRAEREVKELGLTGFHFHPIMGRFRVDDDAFAPLWETLSGLHVPIMIDVGTTGMGAGLPGGLGSSIYDAHPSAVDRLAANFPDLTIVAAHPGWPWIDEVTAVVLHKGNVFWELSGWAPKYFPESLRRDIRGRLRDKIMFGSDYPSIPYERLFREWGDLGLSDEVLAAVFHENAERALGL